MRASSSLSNFTNHADLPMDAKLVVVGGEARVTEVQLKLPVTIGRGRSAGLTLPHPLVSRQHCEIYEEEGKLVVSDLGSLNGTFVGDQRIGEPTFLMPGELLTVGTVTFRAVYELSSDAPEFADEDSTGTDVSAGNRTVRFGDRTVSNVAEVDEVDEVEEVDFAEAEADDVEVEIEDVAEVEDVSVEDAELETEEADEFEAVEEADDVEQLEFEDVALDEEEPPQPKPKPKPTPAPKPAEAAGDTEAADHDTLDVSSSEDAEGSGDDDLQAFLKGLG